MKNIVKIMAVVAALLLATTVSSNAQTPVRVEKTFKGIVKKYEETAGVTCTSVRKDLDAFLHILQEFDVSKEKRFADNNYIRCFASASNSGILSDFVIALENDKSKTVMYMTGEISIPE